MRGRLRRVTGLLGIFLQELLQLLIKELVDQFRSVADRLSVLVENVNRARVLHALRNHQPVNAIGGQIFHVAVQQARAPAVQYAVTVADYGANRCTRAHQRALPDARWQRAQVGMRIGILRAGFELIRSRELRDRDFVLVGMAGPRAIHQAGRLILFVLGKDRKGPRIELRIVAARIKRGHAADGQHAVFVADLRHQRAQILEKGHVVRNGVAIRQNPFRVFQVEVD